MAKTVLIADDTAFMRMTLRNVIEKNGYQVVGEAADGKRPSLCIGNFSRIW